METDKLLNILACPRCKGRLESIAGAECPGFVCQACAVVYPIRNDIPIMLIHEAIPLADWQQAKTTEDGQCASS